MRRELRSLIRDISRFSTMMILYVADEVEDLTQIGSTNDLKNSH